MSRITFWIERDEVDLTAPSNFGCYEARAKVATCAAASNYLPSYFFSRYPARTSPIWNLALIFDPTSWALLFASIFTVTIFFFVSARIGKSYFGMSTHTIEIILSPLR